MKKSGLAAAIAILILLPFFAVQACGPDFRPDVFVRNLRPDHPKEFAAGKLGVLLPTYPRMDLMVAFRYLNGGKLSAEEQAAYTPTYSMFESEQQELPAQPEQPVPTAVEIWNASRNNYTWPSTSAIQGHGLDIKANERFLYQTGYFNCYNDALQTATETLQARAKIWGAESPWLANWLREQDAVFSNCAGASTDFPEAAPANAPELLKADRAYQIAAALFYQGKYDEARNAFAAIHRDTSSSWSGLAGYLEARCLVRKALSTPSPDSSSQSSFDAGPMKEAAELLRVLLREKHPGVSRGAIADELGLITIRIDQTGRAHELASLLAGPSTDPDYRQNLIDLTLVLNGKLDSIPFRQDSSNDLFLNDAQKKINWDTKATDTQRTDAFNKTYKDTADLRTDAPLIDWTLTMQSPSVEARQHALAAWKHTPTLYWLVAAMAKARGDDSETPNLIAAAANVSTTSPAWTTITYHRARLMLESGKSGEARSLLDETLPVLQTAQQDSAANLFRDLRMAAAPDLDGFLRFAPKRVLLRTSESYYASRECLEVMKDPKRSYDCAKTVDADQFSEAASSFFNAQAPLSVLVAAAKSDALPQQLRQSVAMMAWTRSILLHDDAAAKALLPLLPAKLQQQAGDGIGFAAIMALARNPGLRPYLESGVQRSYTYDFVESYRDNWWCKGLAPSWASSSAPFAAETPAFLTREQRKEAQTQLETLSAQEGAQVYLGNLILAYAKDNADDPRTPEALFLVLRMIRYGCDRQPYTPDGKASSEALQEDALKKDVSRLLRQRYASSPWTKKAAPFAG